MKRWIASLLAALLCLSVSAGASAAKPNSVSELTGTTYLDMPAQDYGGPTTTAHIGVTSLQVTDSNIQLAGSVQYRGKTYQMDLNGTFYESQLGSGDKVATAVDATGTFRVLHLAVRRNPSEQVLVQTEAAHGPMFILYLQRTGTREVTMVEVPITALTASSDLEKLLTGTREKGHFGADYWSSKLFQPVPQGFSDVGILAVQDTKLGDWSEYYSVTPDCWVTYKIQFQGYINGPSDIARGAADFNHELKVNRKWTESNCLFYVNETSPYVVGKYADPVVFKAMAWGNGSTYGDVFLKSRFTGTYQKSYNVWENVTISLGVSWKFASVSWSMPLSGPDTTTQSDTEIYSASDPDQWTKMSSYTFTDTYLPQVGYKYQIFLQTAYGSGTRVSKPLKAEWKVPVYADYDDLSTTLYYQTTKYLYPTVYYISG